MGQVVLASRHRCTPGVGAATAARSSGGHLRAFLRWLGMAGRAVAAAAAAARRLKTTLLAPLFPAPALSRYQADQPPPAHLSLPAAGAARPLHLLRAEVRRTRCLAAWPLGRRLSRAPPPGKVADVAGPAWGACAARAAGPLPTLPPVCLAPRSQPSVSYKTNAVKTTARGYRVVDCADGGRVEIHFPAYYLRGGLVQAHFTTARAGLHDPPAQQP